jgi:hypothetical protein
MMEPENAPLLRSRYAGRVYPDMSVSARTGIGVHLNSSGWVDAPSRALHWPRIILVCGALVAGALTLIATTRTVDEHVPATHTSHNLSDAYTLFTNEIIALWPNATVPAFDDPLPQCSPVSSGAYSATAALLRSVMALTNMTCMTPLYVGVPLRAVAWTNTSNVTTVALNPRIVSMSFEQSLIWESNPLWGLAAVPVQRPHRVHVSFVHTDGSRHRIWLNGTNAHCFQSCIQLCSGQSVHEIY